MLQICKSLSLLIKPHNITQSYRTHYSESTIIVTRDEDEAKIYHVRARGYFGPLLNAAFTLFTRVRLQLDAFVVWLAAEMNAALV